MHHVSLAIEILRARPRLVFWAAALAQAALWTLIPALFYAAPPGDLPQLLAIGREFPLGTATGPPLAYWLAEIVFRLTGRSALGLYALSQACIVVTYWGVFALGRDIVGLRHAALAVLLMVGIFAFTLPTPEFSPAILAMPLWTLCLLHYWRAVGQGRRRYWFVLAFELGLLLLTTYVGLLLFTLLLIFTLATERGRAAFGSLEPWVAGVIVVIVIFPHLIWLDQAKSIVIPGLQQTQPAVIGDRVIAWARLVAGLILCHLGLVILVALASLHGSSRDADAPAIVRTPVEPFARKFIYFFALAPAITATLVGGALAYPGSLAGAGPLVVLSGLAVIVAAGDSILIYRQRAVSFAWGALLIVPPSMVVAALLVVPWAYPIDFNVALPAREMGRYFGDVFQRRTGKPLEIVAGEPRTAAMVAFAAPSRPHLFYDAVPGRSPWVTATDIVDKGAVIVWPATDTLGTPPSAIKARFPDLIIETPRAFSRSVQGVQQLVRIGWAVIRPKTSSSAVVAPLRSS
jgi:4-amino-4-deoxy-L-arabinose transferase-like glycosyltransferase